ncbi:MAG: replication protein [Candidatus Latescibacteria bacterium]|nr:replication protein [Candidatus Latescibacterota bacterium]
MKSTESKISPQLEKGYLSIANEIIEALARTKMSAYQSRIIMAILRRTYGFHKKEDQISIWRIANMTGIRETHVSRTLKELEMRKIICRRGKIIGFNKYYDQWKNLPKGIRGY